MLSLEKQLILHWSMNTDDTDSGSIKDRTPYDRHGELLGGVDTDVSSVIGEAFSFNGTDGYLRTPITNPDSEFTISMWIRTTDSNASISGFLDSSTLGTVASHEKEFLLNSDGTVTFRAFDSTQRLANSSTQINDGEWHFIAVTGESTDTIDLYVDGVGEDVVAVNDLFDGYQQPYFFVGIEENKTQYLDGDISSLRIHSRSLSSEEISLLYQLRSTNTSTSDIDRGLAAHWPLSQRTISNGVVKDATPQDNHGDIGGNIVPVDSPVGGGVEFTTDNDFIPTRYFRETTSISETTIAAWIKESETSPKIIYSDDRSEYFRLGLNSGQTGLTFSVQFNDFSTGDNSFLDGEWHHVAAVLNLNAQDEIKLYIDGQEEISANLDNTSSIGTGLKRYGFIGVGSEASSFNGRTGPTNYFTGSISDLRIYDRALSGSEINRLYKQRTTKKSQPNSFVETFSSGNLDRWQVSGLTTITSDRSRRGGFSAFTSSSDHSTYFLKTAPFGNGKQVKEIEYWTQESINGFGSGIRIKNSNDNFECGVALDNPEWDVQDANGFEFTLGSSGNANYDDWVRFTIEFDWSNNTFSLDLEQPATSIRYTESGRPLIEGVDVKYVEIWNYNDGSWGLAGGEIEAWHDSIEVRL